MQNQDFRHKSAQNGNALWLILIAIAMLVTLTLFITRTSEKTADNLSSEQARVIALQVHRQLNTLESAVSRLMLANKCSENEISFENSMVAGYANPLAPADKKCHLFEPEGAGLTWLKQPQGLLLPTAPALAQNGWFFLSSYSVNGVGPEKAIEAICPSDCGDLIAYTHYVDLNVCKEFNKIVSQVDNPVTGTHSMMKGGAFAGTYGTANTVATRIATGSGDATTSTYGSRTACMEYSSSPGVYLIYKVLIAR